MIFKVLLLLGLGVDALSIAPQHAFSLDTRSLDTNLTRTGKDWRSRSIYQVLTDADIGILVASSH